MGCPDCEVDGLVSIDLEPLQARILWDTEVLPSVVDCYVVGAVGELGQIEAGRGCFGVVIPFAALGVWAGFCYGEVSYAGDDSAVDAVADVSKLSQHRGDGYCEGELDWVVWVVSVLGRADV